jgi:hypothetical protein
MNYLVKARARLDLQSHWRYIARDNLPAADGNALQAGQEEITDRKPRRLRGRQDAVDVIDQLFFAIIYDVVVHERFFR